MEKSIFGWREPQKFFVGQTVYVAVLQGRVLKDAYNGKVVGFTANGKVKVHQPDRGVRCFSPLSVRHDLAFQNQ